MAKLILIFVIGLVIYWLIRSYGRRLSRDQEQDQHGKSRAGTETPGLENMVRCSRCGIHLPRSEGILAGGKIYCSEEHRLGKP